MPTPLPIETQTLYAELLERTLAAELRRSFADLNGGFVKRMPSGRPFWYFRSSDGAGGQREFYVGPDDDATRRIMDEYERQRASAVDDNDGVIRMVAMLRSGGITLTDAPSARIIRGLGAAGVFRLGGVLIGTQAYTAIGNAMGVRWASGLQTQDVDLGASRVLGVGLPQTPQLLADLPAAIETLQMGFLPHVQPRAVMRPTSFIVQGKEWRVDFLTEPRGRDRDNPVLIKRLNVFAQPMAFMGYLLERTFDALVIGADATLVRVPEPARFAVHKLLLAGNRTLRQQAKAAKDRQQAFEVLSFLQHERPGDISLAVEDVLHRGPNWAKRVRKEAERLPGVIPELSAALHLGEREPKDWDKPALREKPIERPSKRHPRG